MTLARLRLWAKALRRETLTVWLAARDPRTPWAARLVCAVTAAYALSPIDLIPDFIPVLGLLDDLILLPLGLALAMRLMPRPLLDELRAEAARRTERPRSWIFAGVIAVVWLAAAALAGWAMLEALSPLAP